MLRYTTETISKYWDDENYRIFTFKMTDDKLVILSSNSTNNKLYGFTDTCIGKSLYEVMGKEHAERWHKRFGDWQKEGLISYVAHFENTVAWETSIEIVGSTLFGIGKRISEDTLNVTSLEDHEVFNHYIIQPEDFIIFNITANLESNTYIIDDFISNCNIDLTHFIGSDISSFTTYCSNILDKKVSQIASASWTPSVE